MLKDEEVLNLDGSIICDSPNEFIERWDGNIESSQLPNIMNFGVKQLLLRGCTLRNTDFIYGFVVYTGKETKIMMNAKKPPTKVSNVMRMMNMMLYSIFMFQLLLILLFASLSMIWQANNSEIHYYLGEDTSPGFDTFFIKMLTFWVAYSHLIPISLYVVLEIIKLAQAYLIKHDVKMYDPETGFSICRNSDLIEEMG